MDDSERFSIADVDVPHSKARSPTGELVDGPHRAVRGVDCLICGGLLEKYDRLVHQGACARARKSQLQKRRRELGRL